MRKQWTGNDGGQGGSRVTRWGAVMLVLLGLHGAAQAQGTWVFDQLLSSNVTTSVAASGSSGPVTWDSGATGSASIGVSGNYLKALASGSSYADVTLDETSLGGGAYPSAADMAFGQARWRFTGKQGDSAPVTIIYSLSASGDISISGVEWASGGNFIASTNAAHTIVDVSSSPPSSDHSGFVNLGRASTQQQTFWTAWATLSSQYSTYSLTANGVQYSAGAHYVISTTGSYSTTAGAGAITAYAKAGCDALAGITGVVLYPGRVMGESHAASSCNGSASIKIDY